MYQISLIASYIAGMVALFAPCCVSYLFPAYLGNVFKERKNVIFMTLVYSLGIFVVMMPIVLGAKALQMLFFNLHDQTYLFGGIFMLIVAILSFLGIKLPMPHLSFRRSGGVKNDVFSTFTLGIFSGITSACCAPVLIGVVALSSLSPSTLQALGVGASYVLGMVTPLYVASLFIYKRNILEKPILRKVIGKVNLFGKVYPIFVSNLIATFIFGVTGGLMLWLTSHGKLGMSQAEAGVAKSINGVALTISGVVEKVPGLDVLFVVIITYLMFKFIKNVFGTSQTKTFSGKYTCPMHSGVVSDKPGSCPKCNMPLVAKDLENGVGNHSEHMHHNHGSHEDMMASPEAAKDFLRRFYIVSVLLIPLLVFSKFGLNVPVVEFGISTAIFYFGLVFFEHARHEIMARQYGMMTLVSMGIGAGYIFSAVGTFFPAFDVEFYLEISTLIWVLLFGHFLEAKSSMAAGDALKEVAKLLPKMAHLKVGSETREVEVSSLKKGDIVLVRAGEKVPADGVVLKGSANFNEAHITGESRPIEKKVNDGVVAGAINIDGAVEVRLVKIGENSTIGQIQSLIASAKQTKPSAQRLADRASKWLTFIALGVSLFTFLFWFFVAGQTLVFALTLAITVLVIACPHALGLAIPTVSTIAMRLAVHSGVFIKDMAKIEVVKKADWVVFDKTGTLTQGNFKVASVNAKGQMTNDKIIEIAASLEQYSSHFIGKAIVSYAKDRRIKIRSASKIRNIAGKGIEGYIGRKKYFVGRHGTSSVGVLENGKMIGEIVLEDVVRKESKRAVFEFHKLGLKVAMLTGDSSEVADKVGEKLGIDTVFAEVLPEDKYKYIKDLQKKGNVVLMAGDGVNDAPALTQANVGVAIGAGTDVAVEAGDIILTRDNPEDLVRLVVLSRKVYKKMIENLFWALGYNVVAIPAAAGFFIPFGFRLTPAVGAFVMSLSSVVVVVNAISLRRVRLIV